MWLDWIVTGLERLEQTRSAVYRQIVDEFIKTHKDDVKQQEALSSERLSKKWNKIRNTYHFYKRQIEALNELAARTGIKRSELFRMAVDEYTLPK